MLHMLDHALLAYCSSMLSSCATLCAPPQPAFVSDIGKVVMYRFSSQLLFGKSGSGH